ncbi:exopolyphosphatase/guanosine-5'-triphosphate,3'-diphosphate pyrophosphatase [Luteibacter rhizovicinus]|uniref:Exopolyphosphatase/guanosine-5'-triphosphate, 3'-diphosphate pyrophosphatase n=1 Tax=Luteibacter rhizovicinus TaxID=242606 RepID=A0A4R3YTZ1_9GAMM|nr:Ppx/GppA phosphatase family protein [Luteibacter rhizovicinus]TCV94623.1 exopolyphosphatase/guanosine-5'-triphosphate,3'-diphosphate pyrophosphatase [Luteibacter rhizovicinus]
MSNAGKSQINEGELLAAVDLGSNSFHMVVARFEHGEPRVIDRLRDSVRMAVGLRSDGTLDAEHRAAALASLARFGQRIAGIPAMRVRAVATNTVRRLASPQAFLSAAEAALGHPVEIVSGREEGRLIFLGAAHDLPASRDHRLVIDIGGGSTEFIIGRGTAPLHTESVQVGCIASTMRFFPGGKITRKRWQKARREIGVLLQQFGEEYREAGWADAYGSSGTAKSIGAVVRAMKLSDNGITAAALATVREAIIEQGQSSTLKLPGLADDRAEVFAGGVAIFEAAFESLGIERLGVSESSMREGLLWDLMGRAVGTDPRTASIDALASRYGVDRAQARRVETTALGFFDQVAKAWKLDDDAREWLSWAARVHELGLAIAHSQHQRHGAYILRHADLAGFSRQEQQLLAAIVECHRRKPEKSVLASLPVRYRMLAKHITALLRLGVLFRRARRAEALPRIRVAATRQRLRLSMPADWLDQHPLTEADLEQEREPLADLGLQLELATE